MHLIERGGIQNYPGVPGCLGVVRRHEGYGAGLHGLRGGCELERRTDRMECFTGVNYRWHHCDASVLNARSAEAVQTDEQPMAQLNFGPADVHECVMSTTVGDRVFSPVHKSH
jgi:hypothetical protein